MGRMKDKFIEEQERIALDSLYDAKYYEVQDEQYEEELKLRSLAENELISDEENEFITQYSQKNKSKTIKSKKKCVE
tara:strand:- start:10191 stop:10421 length:231 start_codon:yes stop_codon:yes gene_type:complete